MSGTMDWIERATICPVCGKETNVNVCIVTDTKKMGWKDTGIAGGTNLCFHCGAKITDENVIYKEDDEKAYLVTISIQTRVLAKDEDEAEDNAIDKVSNDPMTYIVHGNIEDIQIDKEDPYNKRLEEQCN